MRILAVLGTIALAGCTTDALINAAYPDGERFQFTNAAGDTALFYVCEGGPDAASRAQQAHAFLDGNINALAERAATGLINRAEEGQGALGNAIALNRELNANVEEIVAQTDARFQCLMYDQQDI